MYPETHCGLQREKTQFKSREHTEFLVISSGWLQRWVSSDVINGSSVWRLQGLWRASDKPLTASGEEMGQDWLTMIWRESKKGERRPERKREKEKEFGGCICMSLCIPHIHSHAHTYPGPGNTAWYPWQPQWNVFKVVMSMLSLTDRQTGSWQWARTTKPLTTRLCECWYVCALVQHLAMQALSSLSCPLDVR